MYINRMDAGDICIQKPWISDLMKLMVHWKETFCRVSLA